MKQDNQEGISKAVLEGKEDSVDRRIVPLFWPSLPLFYLLYHRIVFYYIYTILYDFCSNTTLLIPSWLSRFIMPSTVSSTTLLLDLCSSYVLTLYILR